MLIIRDIKEQDREQVIAMMKGFYKSPACLHAVPEENFHNSITAFLNGSPYTRTLVLEEQKDGKEPTLAGYANIALGWSNEAGGLLIWFEELMLLPETRGKGYGTEVFKFVENAYPQAKRIRLEVTKENNRAIALYERLGYEEFPYYQMSKDLV